MNLQVYYSISFFFNPALFIFFLEEKNRAIKEIILKNLFKEWASFFNGLNLFFVDLI